MPPLTAALYYLSFLLLLSLSVFVLRRDPGSPLHRYFSAGALALFGWLATLYVFDLRQDPSTLLLLGRANFAASELAVLLGFLFVAELTGRRSSHSRALAVETLLLGAVAMLTPLIDRAELVLGGQHVTDFGALFPLHLAHIALYPAAAALLAFRAARTAPPRLKGQLSVVGAGICATAVIAVAADLVLPYGFRIFSFQDAGALSTILFIGSVAYAITVHHLFDFRIIVRKTVVFALLLAFVHASYSAIVLFLTESLPYGSLDGRYRLALEAAGILVVAFGFDPLKEFLEERTDRFLFRREYERQAVLTELASDLNVAPGLDGSLTAVLRSLSASLHPVNASVFAFEPGGDGSPAVKRLRQTGRSDTARMLALAKGPVLEFFGRCPSPVRIDALAHEVARDEAGAAAGKRPPAGHSSEARDAAVRECKAREVAAAVPLRIGDQLVGLLLAGPRRSGEGYGRDDLALLEGVGQLAASAIQKARLYEGDQAKSELVSIAAHELLTPIAAVQGYLSMILDEHLGEVDQQARGYLERAYPAIQRLSLLVKDLLSVSRLEAGRIRVEPRPTEVVPLIRAVLDQLAPVAREKGLELSFEEPAALPLALADPDRLTEVLVNLVGNALKYTKEGSVTVRAESLRDGKVRIEVQDTGLGIAPEAQKRLFEKFYRVATEETASIPGTGLGLYITKQMVEKMGGTISIRSASGAGSAFSLGLPAVG